MQVTIQGKQIDLGQSLRQHVEDTLEALDEKFFNHAAYATTTFSREGHGHGLVKTHIAWQIGKGIQLQAEACENSAPLAFDVAYNRLLQQLRKQKQKLRGNHHHDRLAVADDAAAPVEAFGLDTIAAGSVAPEGPAIVAEMAAEIETLSVSQAASRLEYHDQPALLFRNASHDGVNMVYRRPDGNVGWVDPAGNHVIASQSLGQFAGQADGHARRA